jgi:hypothetical protein
MFKTKQIRTVAVLLKDACERVAIQRQNRGLPYAIIYGFV